MKLATLALLRCKFCGGTLQPARRIPESGDEIESGTLRCVCGEIPVLGGIPICRRGGRVDRMKQTSDAASSPGPEVRRLLNLIESGRSEEALGLVLMPPGRWVRRQNLIAEILPRWPRDRLRRIAEDSWTRQAAREAAGFVSPSSTMTVREVFERYYSGDRRSELRHHFFHRFAQPRHLTSLSLATLLWDDAGPGLDLACGFGHALHILTLRAPGRTWIGLDRNFFSLYVARRWVAPRAEYVCAEADGAFPFSTGAFSGVLCADAFHNFLRKCTCAEELRRVTTDDGTIVLSRVGNALQEPREGFELPPDAYRALFPGEACRLVADRELLDRYLSGRGPDLSRDTRPGVLAEEKWISLVVSRNPGVFRDHGPLESWPHGLGKRARNPLYVANGPTAGTENGFTLTMPSEWFEFENGGCRVYMPEHVTLDDRAESDLNSGKDSAEIEELVRRCVVLGFPEKYL